jgi:hypothetical protein
MQSHGQAPQCTTSLPLDDRDDGPFTYVLISHAIVVTGSESDVPFCILVARTQHSMRSEIIRTLTTIDTLCRERERERSQSLTPMGRTPLAWYYDASETALCSEFLQLHKYLTPSRGDVRGPAIKRYSDHLGINFICGAGVLSFRVRRGGSPVSVDNCQLNFGDSPATHAPPRCRKMDNNKWHDPNYSSPQGDCRYTNETL